MTGSTSKRCTQCHRDLPRAQFQAHKDTADRLFPWCAECQNSRHHVLKMRKTTWSVNEVLTMLYLDQPCADCNQSFRHWCQLGFDHVDPSNKSFSIGSNSHNDATEARTLKWLAEVEKCELVCHNCHALRTRRQNQERRAWLLNTAYDYFMEQGREDLWINPSSRPTTPR